MRILKIFDSVPLFYSKHTNFKIHRRLRVFWEKGCTCVKCGLSGNKIIKSKAKNSGIHYDLYHWTKDKKVLMTVDHIIPKSLGGTRDISNLQPMCSKCNNKKADAIWLPYRELEAV